MHKERFPELRRYKLMPRGDGPSQILEIINDNVYKVNLPGEYGVNATSNVSYISLFDVGEDSRLDPFKKRGEETIQTTRKDPVEVPIGPITR
jgi:hypothetical protein